MDTKCKIDRNTDNSEISVEVFIEDKQYIFYDKWVKRPKSINLFTHQTGYKRPKNILLLIKGYIISRERILLLRLIQILFDINKCIKENKDTIIDKINIQNLSTDEIKSIDSILENVRNVLSIKGQKTLMIDTMNELRLYKYKNKVFGTVDCPFKLREYLPKVKFGNMYIINNLLSRCPNINYYDITHGWLNIIDKQYAWMLYIIKYHINSFDYKTSHKNNDIFCMPTTRFGTLKRSGKINLGWVAEDQKISYIIEPMIYNTINKCYKNNGIFVSPFSFFIFNKQRKFGHGCVLIINFKKKEIIFSNPWGIICKGSDCWQSQTYNTTFEFLKYMKQKVVCLKDFNIKPFYRCSPMSGPQGEDFLCSTWSMMIIHLYMLNYKNYSLYEIIEYLNNSSYDNYGYIKVAQYDYITRQIIPENLTKDWFKKSGLSVPVGY